MILKQIKHNGIEVMVAIAILAAGMAASMFLGVPARHIDLPNDGTPLFNTIYSHVFGGHISIGTQLVSLILLGLEIMMMILLNSDFEFTRAKPSMFALVGIPLALSLVPNNTLLPEQIANIFIALGLIKMIAGHGLDNATYTVFDSGLFFGVAALFCLPALMMIPVGIMGLIIFRPFRGKEFLVFLVGCITPILFYMALYYIVEGNVSDLAGYLRIRLGNIQNVSFSPKETMAVMVHGIIVLLGSACITREYPKFNLIGSQAYRLFFLMFVSMAGMCLTPYFGVQVLRLALMPLAMMLITAFHEMRDSLWSDIAMLLFVLCYVGVQALWYM